MNISLKQSLSLAAATCLALTGPAFAKTGASGGSNARGAGSTAASRGNLSNQRSELRTDTENTRLRTDDMEVQENQDVDRDSVKTRKIKKTRLTNPGNSEFGRSQRVNHLRGSGNNIHGKTTSANAKLKHANKKTND
jgi:hypothetical protein